MKQRKRAESSTLFLLELLLSVFLFAVLSAVCISIFAKAHTLSLSSEELTEAVSETENASSLLRVSSSEDEFLQQMLQYYPDAEEDSSLVRVYYDQNFATCPAGDASYCMTAKVSMAEEGLLRASMSFERTGKASSESGDAIYSQTAEHAIRAGNKKEASR